MTDTPAHPSAETLPSEAVRDAGQDDAWLKRLSRRLVQDEEDARDLAQDTWLAALRNPPLQGERRAWLTATARRLAARRWSTPRERSLDEVETDAFGSQEPDRTAEDEEARHLLNAAVTSLSEEDREVIVWRWNEGLSYQEIANRLGLTRPTATYRIERALQNLRTRLRGLAPGAALLGLAGLTRRSTLRRRPTLTAAWVGAAGVAAATLLSSLLPRDPIRLVQASQPIEVAEVQRALARSSALVPNERTSEEPRFPEGSESRFQVARDAPTPTAHILTSEELDALVDVRGRVLINGEPTPDWRVMVIPIEPGFTVRRLRGQDLCDRDGQYMAQCETGKVLLALFPALSNGAIFTALEVENETLVHSYLDTGSLRVNTSQTDPLWLISYGAFGLYMNGGRAEEGSLHFELVPAGKVSIYRDDGWPYIEDGTLLGEVQIAAGQETTVDFP